MVSEVKQSAKRVKFIQQYRQKLQQELDKMGYPGGKLAHTAVTLTENEPPAQIDTRDNVHSASESSSTTDPGSQTRRVSLVR